MFVVVAESRDVAIDQEICTLKHGLQHLLNWIWALVNYLQRSWNMSICHHGTHCHILDWQLNVVDSDKTDDNANERHEIYASSRFNAAINWSWVQLMSSIISISSAQACSSLNLSQRLLKPDGVALLRRSTTQERQSLQYHCHSPRLSAIVYLDQTIQQQDLNYSNWATWIACLLFHRAHRLVRFNISECCISSLRELIVVNKWLRISDDWRVWVISIWIEELVGVHVRSFLLRKPSQAPPTLAIISRFERLVSTRLWSSGIVPFRGHEDVLHATRVETMKLRVLISPGSILTPSLTNVVDFSFSKSAKVESLLWS